MDYTRIHQHVQAYLSVDQIQDAVHFILRTFRLDHPNLESVEIRPSSSSSTVLLTAEGPLKGRQKVYVPSNLFQFNFNLVLNLLAHELLHVRQRDPEFFVEDKNEREFQAYYEMLFHKVFPQIPDAPDFNRKQFAQKALLYYSRMEAQGPLQVKYEPQRMEVQTLLDALE